MFKRLKPPSPKELGWSESGALGSRKLSPFHEGKTWEDWEDHVKDKYPVRYFLTNTLPDWFSPVWYSISNFWYWLKCHTLKSCKFHLVDLRGVDPLSSYQYGFLDPRAVLELSAWKALRDYIEKCKPENPALHYTEEELKQSHLAEEKLKRYDEPHALYKYWMVDRLMEAEREAVLYRQFKEASREDKATYERAAERWSSYRFACEAREQEMFMRLCAIRQWLWT